MLPTSEIIEKTRERIKASLSETESISPFLGKERETMLKTIGTK